MVDRLTKHPYSDARNSVVVALALWSLAAVLAAASGALGRMGGPLVASLIVFMSGIAVASTTMDRRIGAWIASWPPVSRLAGSGASRWLAVLAVIVSPLAVAQAAKVVAQGRSVELSALLLVATPALAGLAGALVMTGIRGQAVARENLVPLARELALTRGSR